MRPDIERKAQMMCDDAKEIRALMNHGAGTVILNAPRARAALKCIIEDSQYFLRMLENMEKGVMESDL